MVLIKLFLLSFVLFGLMGTNWSKILEMDADWRPRQFQSFGLSPTCAHKLEGELLCWCSHRCWERGKEEEGTQVPLSVALIPCPVLRQVKTILENPSHFHMLLYYLITYPATPFSHLAFKNPWGSFGLFLGHEPPISFHSPAINLSLLQIPTFWCVWPHCALGTQTCTNTASSLKSSVAGPCPRKSRARDRPLFVQGQFLYNTAFKRLYS